MISFAEKIDIPHLKKLWQISFGDENEYIDFFFENRFDEKECIVFKENNVPVSMLFAFDCSLSDGLKGKYIYAACTLPQCRGKGIMEKLIEYAKEAFINDLKYDFLCLVPASERLFGYYAKFGFKPFFKHEITSLTNNDPELKVFTALQFEDFVLLREKFLSNAVRWGENHLKYIFDENLFRAGKNIKINDGYVLFREEDDTCTIIEYAGDIKEKDFLSLTKCKKVNIRKPAADDSFKYNGMIFTGKSTLLNSNDTFLSLVLD